MQKYKIGVNIAQDQYFCTQLPVVTKSYQA